jgi:predicted alpha/beta hydrolase
MRGRGEKDPQNAKDRRGLAEAIEVHTSDGHVLRAMVREPERGQRLRGVAVLAHAMFARKSEWERGGRGLSSFLNALGWRTIAFDFRGHGESGTGAAKGGRWTYEDLVARDLPAVVDGARARARGRRVIVVGHSLGGHVAAAAQASASSRRTCGSRRSSHRSRERSRSGRSDARSKP